MQKDFEGKTKFISDKKNGGFTIIELLVASALSLVLMTGIYSVYRSQQKSYVVREQITSMQQNLRAGMVMITSDIRMAGYVYPSVILTGGVTPGIIEANTNDLKFRLLKDKDNPPASTDPETIRYSLNDKDGDGDTDLVKEVDGGVPQLVAENIDVLSFSYLDITGTVIADPPSNLGLIKSIQVTMQAKTGKKDQGYADNGGFRTRTLSREIKCRNL